MRGLDLDRFRALTEVVELGNFSAATRRLNLTKPRETLQICKPEGHCCPLPTEHRVKQERATAPTRQRIKYIRDIVCESELA
jgi:hypothetical protein